MEQEPLDIIQNANSWCITKEIRGYIQSPIYLYKNSPSTILWSSQRDLKFPLLISFVWKYLPTVMLTWRDVNAISYSHLVKANIDKDDLVIINQIIKALNGYNNIKTNHLTNQYLKKEDNKMKLINETKEEPMETPKTDEVKRTTTTADKVSYVFDKEWYEQHHEAVDGYLTKQKIKHTWKELKTKKNAGKWELTIPELDKKRFTVRMNLLKLKINSFLKK